MHGFFDRPYWHERKAGTKSGFIRQKLIMRKLPSKIFEDHENAIDF